MWVPPRGRPNLSHGSNEATVHWTHLWGHPHGQERYSHNSTQIKPLGQAFTEIYSGQGNNKKKAKTQRSFITLFIEKTPGKLVFNHFLNFWHKFVHGSELWFEKRTISGCELMLQRSSTARHIVIILFRFLFSCIFFIDWQMSRKRAEKKRVVSKHNVLIIKIWRNVRCLFDVQQYRGFFCFCFFSSVSPHQFVNFLS